MGKKGKSICLFSSKGGTGKSSIATLLSGEEIDKDLKSVEENILQLLSDVIKWVKSG